MKPIFTVSEVTRIIKNLLESSEFLRQVFIRGEISNFKHHISGHMYFTLKDEKAQIRCVMFKSSSMLLSFIPENGMKVIAFGHIGVFDKSGEYQLYVDDLEPDGIGALHVAFERLKTKLEKEGLFDEARKKKLPFIPQKIGLVTSISGAAIRDLLTVIRRRFPNVNIIIAPVLVQGKEAACEISSAIENLNRLEDIDVIIVGRGGGSIEELWAFNEEKVARAIYNSKIPVISAVGHETDFTIADFVADKRAPTPSAAGELVVPEKRLLKEKIENLKSRLINAIVGNISIKRQRLEYIKKSGAFNRSKNTVLNYRLELDQQIKRLLKAMKRHMESKKLTFKTLGTRLNALSPLSILERGYSICQKPEDGRIIKKISDVKILDYVWTVLTDGMLLCRVEDIKEKGGNHEGI